MMRHITILVVATCIAYNQTQQCCLPSQMQASLLVSDPYIPIKDRQHESYMFNETKCFKGGTDPWDTVFRCVPKNAVASKPYRLGWNPNITLVDYYWQQEDKLRVQLSLSNCSVPIEMTVWYNHTGTGVRRTVFQDFVPTIIDEHTFDVPNICKKALMMEDNQKVQLGNLRLGG